MDALTKLAVKQSLTGALVKQALRMADVEDELGFYIDKKHHKRVRGLIEERKAKSFSLRHPWLTGIPTLGLAPAIAKGRAIDSITRTLARENKGLRTAHMKAKEREAKRELEYERAVAPVRAAATLGNAYLLSKQLEDRRRDR